MNLFSLLSYVNFIAFTFVGIYSLGFSNVKTRLNTYSFWVCGSLGIWNLAYVFFYGASSRSSAFLWHQVACLGMSFFPVFTLNFFLVLTGINWIIQRRGWNILLYIPALFLSIMNIGFNYSPMATGFVQSEWGLGWTYGNHLGNPLFVATFLYLMIYFALIFTLLIVWRKNCKYTVERKQASVFLVVDLVVLILGALTDFILPLFGSWIPPMANLFSFLFVAFYWYIIRNLHVFDVNRFASSELIFHTIIDPVIVFNDNYTVLNANVYCGLLLSRPASELVGQSIEDCFQMEIASTLRAKDHGEISVVDQNGTKRWLTFSKSLIEDEMNGFLGKVIVMKEITRLREAEKKLRMLNEKYVTAAKELYEIANFDALTGLYNRRMFFMELDKCTLEYQVSGVDFVLIYMDLNGFKQINDLYGHSAGDVVLAKTAERLRRVCPEDGILARIGGDEFVMLLGYHPGEAEIESILERLTQTVNAPIPMNGADCLVGCACGFAVYSQCRDQLELLQKADAGMYENKMKSKRII